MIILGIDPGTATTGFAVIEKSGSSLQVVDYGVISTSPKHSDAARLLQLATDLEELIKKHQPKLAGLEKLFFQNNQKTAMSVAQARGAIMLKITENHIPLVEYTPLQVKNRICGNGSAQKSQVQFMVKKLLGLKTIPKPDDAADALAIAWCASGENLL